MKENEEKTKLTVSKLPIQDTRVFYENYTNYENLNNLIMGEIEGIKKKDPIGLPGGNVGCWRSIEKYKCEAELYKAIGLMLSSWADHYFPNKPMDAQITYLQRMNR